MKRLNLVAIVLLFGFLLVEIPCWGIESATLQDMLGAHMDRVMRKSGLVFPTRYGEPFTNWFGRVVMEGEDALPFGYNYIQLRDSDGWAEVRDETGMLTCEVEPLYEDAAFVLGDLFGFVPSEDTPPELRLSHLVSKWLVCHSEEEPDAVDLTEDEFRELASARARRIPRLASAPLVVTNLMVTAIRAESDCVNFVTEWPSSMTFPNNRLDFYTSVDLCGAWAFHSSYDVAGVNAITTTVMKTSIAGYLESQRAQHGADCYITTNIVASTFEPNVSYTNCHWNCGHKARAETPGFFRWADQTDSDGDGDSDAFECWVSGTDPFLSDAVVFENEYFIIRGQYTTTEEAYNPAAKRRLGDERLRLLSQTSENHDPAGINYGPIVREPIIRRGSGIDFIPKLSGYFKFRIRADDYAEVCIGSFPVSDVWTSNDDVGEDFVGEFDAGVVYPITTYLRNEGSWTHLTSEVFGEYLGPKDEIGLSVPEGILFDGDWLGCTMSYSSAIHTNGWLVLDCSGKGTTVSLSADDTGTSEFACSNRIDSAGLHEFPFFVHGDRKSGSYQDVSWTLSFIPDDGDSVATNCASTVFACYCQPIFVDRLADGRTFYNPCSVYKDGYAYYKVEVQPELPDEVIRWCVDGDIAIEGLGEGDSVFIKGVAEGAATLYLKVLGLSDERLQFNVSIFE